jgi:hypothetical protein
MIICFYLSISTPVPPLIPNIQLSSLNGCGLGSSNNVNEEFTSSFIPSTSENPLNILKSKKHSLLSNKTIDGLKRKIGSILTKVQIINKTIKKAESFNGVEMDGRKLTVNEAKPLEKRPFRPMR